MEHGAGTHNISQPWVDFTNYYWLNYKPIVYSEQKNSTIFRTKTQVIGRYSSEGGFIIPSEVLDYQHGMLKYSFSYPHSEKEDRKFWTEPKPYRRNLSQQCWCLPHSNNNDCICVYCNIIN